MKIKVAAVVLLIILIITGYVNAKISSTLQSGENITTEGEFEVKLNLDTKISAAQFTIKYDKEVLEFIDIEGHGGKAINNKEAGKVIAAFISTEYSDAPFTIMFKALKQNQKTKIQLKEVSFVVEDTTAENGVRLEETSVQDITIKPSDLTKIEGKLDANNSTNNTIEGSQIEQELVTELNKQEITRPDPNLQSTNTFDYKIIIYIVIGIAVIAIIAGVFLTLKKGNTKKTQKK